MTELFSFSVEPKYHADIGFFWKDIGLLLTIYKKFYALYITASSFIYLYPRGVFMVGTMIRKNKGRYNL